MAARCATPRISKPSRLLSTKSWRPGNETARALADVVRREGGSAGGGFRAQGSERQDGEAVVAARQGGAGGFLGVLVRPVQKRAADSGRHGQAPARARHRGAGGQRRQ